VQNAKRPYASKSSPPNNFQCDTADVSGASVIIALTVRRSFQTDVLSEERATLEGVSQAPAVWSRELSHKPGPRLWGSLVVRHYTSRSAQCRRQVQSNIPVRAYRTCAFESSYSSGMMHGCSNLSKQQATVARSRDFPFHDEK